MRRGIWTSLWLLLLVLGGVASPAAADPLEGAAWRVTATGVDEQGIRA